MRSTSRFLAAVKSAAKYLEPNTPTGLTGLTTHPSPRPALIYTYRETLSKLKQIPESSVYRQSTEALTNHRLKIIESTKPAGYDEWLQRVQKVIEDNPAAYGRFQNSDGSLSQSRLYVEPVDNWDGVVKRTDSKSEGPNTPAEAERKARAVLEEAAIVDKAAAEGELPTVQDLEVEPPLSAEQINEIENKIGAGLIEEVVEVAEGELTLVDEMLQARPWEDLEEKSPPGQWEYFERGDRV